MAVLSHDTVGPGADSRLLSPAVYHAESQVGIVSDVDFGYADMQGIVRMVGGGASSDHLQRCIVLDDDDVVEILDGLVLVQKHAGLERIFDVVSGFHPDEVTVPVLEVGLCGVLVLGRVHGLPVIVLQSIVFLHGLCRAHELQTFLHLGGAVAGLVVDEHQCTGAVHLVCDDSDVLHVSLVVGALKVVDLDLVVRSLLVVFEVDVLSVGGLLLECLSDGIAVRHRFTLRSRVP